MQADELPKSPDAFATEAYCLVQIYGMRSQDCGEEGDIVATGKRPSSTAACTRIAEQRNRPMELLASFEVTQ